MNKDEAPKSLKYPDVRQRRLAAIEDAHIETLTKYVRELRGRSLGEIPYFDPFDGGAKARILFLFEKPGPKTSVDGGGSGFVSRNNNDDTAAATLAFMEQAGLARKDVVIWNTIPAWNNAIDIKANELSASHAHLRNLMALLPNLKGIVLVGGRSQKAWKSFGSSDFPVIYSPHPSPKVRNFWPDRWNGIPGIWSQANKFLD